MQLREADVAEPTPPSIEQLHHEIHKWLTTTEAGRALAGTNAAQDVADGYRGHFPDVDPELLGALLLRCASFLGSQRDLPLWVLVNLTGAAGARLREEAAHGR